METFESQLYFFFFFLFFGMAIGEFVISAFWIPFYFRFGIPLYQQTIKLTEMPQDIALNISQLEQQLPRTWWRGAIAFKALGPHELAFRQKFNSRQAVHGRILIDPFQQELSITGYLYWSLLLFPILLLAFGFVNGTFLPFLVFMLLIVVINVVQQRTAYGRISQAIQNTFQIQNLPEQPYFSSSHDYNPSPTTRSTGLTSIEILLLLILTFMAFVTATIFTIVWLSRG